MANARPRKRPRKQLLLKLGVFLLLGAIVNVAVAWGLVFAINEMRVSGPSISYRGIEAANTPYDPPGRWGATKIKYRFLRDEPLSLSPPELSRADEGTFYFLTVYYWGLPARSTMSAVVEKQLVQTGSYTLPQMHSAFGWVVGGEPAGSFLRPNVLPLRPIWPGFAINTIFYAAMLWLLWLAPGRIRRFIRVKRHRCPACGYEIAEGVGPRCSECGAALPASWSAKSP
jgi:hypothetical protein